MADQAPHSAPVPQVPPLVGREREQATLRDALAAALAGRGSLALIGGEAGIGKTSLAEAICAEAAAQGALALVGRCYDLAETPPYGPWAELFATRAADRDPVRLPAPLGDGEIAASQAALFAAVRDHLAALTARQPAILLLDDQHWADPASLDLLRALARQASGLPLLLLVTYRSDELSRRHPLSQLLPLLVREARASQLDLRPLPDEAVHELVRARYPLRPADQDRLVRYLRERAEGHPFFLGELLSTLEEVGDLGTTGDGWRLGDLGALRVPRLLRQVVEGRLTRLPDEDQRLLAVAAVIGQEVPLDLWASVAGVGEDALLETAERAATARLAEETADGTRVRFVHALVREALYEGIQPSRRRAWHRRTSEALAATTAPDPDAVAHHFRQAGDLRAADWLAKAGERAQRAYAYLTAADRYEAALALLPDDEGRREERAWLHYRVAQVREMADARRALLAVNEAGRLADMLDDRALAAAVLIVRGGINVVLGGPPDGLEAGVAAVDALTSGERARLNRLVTLGAEVSDLNPYAATLIYVRGWGGRPEDTLVPGERFVAQAPPPSAGHGISAAFAEYFGDTYLVLCMAYAMQGRPDDARRAIAEARAAYGLMGAPWQLGEAVVQELTMVVLPYQPERIAERRRLADEVVEQFGRATGMGMVEPRLHRVPLMMLEGDWAEARALVEDGLTNANLSGGRMMSRMRLGLLAREQGELELAWAQVREIVPNGHEAPVGGWGELHCQRLAIALALDAGDLPTARAWLEAYDGRLAWSGVLLGRAEGQLGWAAYHREARDLTAAREHAARALAHASDPRQPLALLAAHRLLGELATGAGSYTDAAAHLDEALALAEACAAPYERALTLLALAELHHATGASAAARSRLDEARATLEPLEARPALARVEALRAKLAPDATPTYPAGLTAREVEVLRLVARGLSDAEVAERLYVSVNTVKTHLRSIYSKLDVPSRTAAARFATDHGLA